VEQGTSQKNHRRPEARGPRVTKGVLAGWKKVPPSAGVKASREGGIRTGGLTRGKRSTPPIPRKNAIIPGQQKRGSQRRGENEEAKSKEKIFKGKGVAGARPKSLGQLAWEKKERSLTAKESDRKIGGAGGKKTKNFPRTLTKKKPLIFSRGGKRRPWGKGQVKKKVPDTQNEQSEKGLQIRTSKQFVTGTGKEKKVPGPKKRKPPNHRTTPKKKGGTGVYVYQKKRKKKKQEKALWPEKGNEMELEKKTKAAKMAEKGWTTPPTAKSFMKGPPGLTKEKGFGAGVYKKKDLTRNWAKKKKTSATAA